MQKLCREVVKVLGENATLFDKDSIINLEGGKLVEGVNVVLSKEYDCDLILQEGESMTLILRKYRLPLVRRTILDEEDLWNWVHLLRTWETGTPSEMVELFQT